VLQKEVSNINFLICFATSISGVNSVVQQFFYSGYNGEHCLSWIQGDAEALSFEDGSMDGYTIAFGIRNVTHIEKALAEAYRLANSEIPNKKTSSAYASSSMLEAVPTVLSFHICVHFSCAVSLD